MRTTLQGYEARWASCGLVLPRDYGYTMRSNLSFLEEEVRGLSEYEDARSHLADSSKWPYMPKPLFTKLDYSGTNCSIA